MSATAARRTSRTLVMTLTWVLASSASVAYAEADNDIIVWPGDSIQQAVERAPDGATVTVRAGTYRQHVLLTKPLTLLAQGRVVLRAPASVTPNQCTEQVSGESGTQADVGLCVQGALGGRDAFGELIVVSPVKDVTVSGFEIVGFTEGLLAYGTDQLRVSRVDAHHNADVGLFSGAGTRTAVERVTASHNGSSGIRIDTSRNVALLNSTSRDNGWGVGINEVARAEISGNRLTGNCVGLLAFDTSEPTPTGLFDVHDNQVTDNNRFCPADGGPSLTGLGVGLIGTTDVHLHDNAISHNRQSRAADLGGAGVLLLDATDLTGGSLPIHNVIESNDLRRNSPEQVVWDGTGLGNEIRDNRCTPACV